jgi:hypothetical protein
MATKSEIQLEVSEVSEEGLTVALIDWWEAEVSSREADPFASSGTLYDAIVEMDSLSVLNGLLTVEACVGFKLPVKIIKRGGYRDRQEMVDHLVPQIRELCEKRRRSLTIA